MASDDMAALLMAKMRGDSRPSPAQGRPVDPGAQMIMDGLRGGSERDARKAQAEQHNRDFQARQTFESRVRRRIRELVDRHEGGQHPEETAREQLRREDLEAKRQADKRAVYDQMVANNRAEAEANSTENLRGRIRETAAQRRSEKADAALVAALRAITGAHR